LDRLRFAFGGHCLVDPSQKRLYNLAAQSWNGMIPTGDLGTVALEAFWLFYAGKVFVFRII
jgi:hypothetical protein